VGTVYEGIVQYMVDHCFEGQSRIPWFNPVVGETSDAGLNDIGGLHFRPEHAVKAIQIAETGPVLEGSVGGGTAMSALGWKGGIGTSSRIVEVEGESATVGILVQANFGGVLTVSGVRMHDLEADVEDERGAPPSRSSMRQTCPCRDLNWIVFPREQCPGWHAPDPTEVTAAVTM
jgi:L-aminopeptidase/D-esterase-like protein